jgi:hypothetical protein
MFASTEAYRAGRYTASLLARPNGTQPGSKPCKLDPATPVRGYAMVLRPNLIAYTSNESGRFEVYVQTIPPSEKKWQVSTNGGYEPRWRGDGREIYYLSEDRKVMAVAAEPGPSFGLPRSLFQTRVSATVIDGPIYHLRTNAWSSLLAAHLRQLTRRARIGKQKWVVFTQISRRSGIP